MSFSKDGNSDPTSENVEQEDKVKVEEASVNLDCVKREFDEEELEFEHKQYKIALTFKNVFGESSTQLRSNRDGLIGFLDGVVVMETGSVKLEDVKEENKDLIQKNMEESYLEIIQCRWCKVWLEKQEHLERHMLHCFYNYNRSCRNLPDFAPTTTDNEEQVHENEEITTSIDVNASYSTLPADIIDSNNCVFRTEVHKDELFHDKNMGTTHSNTNNLKSHLGTHSKYFQCDICKQRFGQKSNLNVHIKNKHSNTNEKDYKCSECAYQTNQKCHLKVHLSTHTDVKDFQCDICKQRFTQKSNLNVHIKTKHLNANEKEYECSECFYQTNLKYNLKIHLVSHTDVKNFQCDICKQRFGHKGHLNAHIKDKHSNTNEKEYNCSACSYQTNRKGDLKSHLVSHTGVKNFQCDICEQRFGQKSHLQRHIKNKHLNRNEKEYKCSECSFQTKWRSNLKTHLDTHTNVKNFVCDICKQRFGYKRSLIMHIKNKHSNTNEKEYKCSECSFQTNHKGNLKSHSLSHTDVKNFECDICIKRFGRKSHLQRHIKNKHSNTNEKE